MSSKIKMTKEQKFIFDKALAEAENHKNDFVYFIDTLEIVDGLWPLINARHEFDRELTEFREDSRWFMRAWLNPEDIEVED